MTYFNCSIMWEQKISNRATQHAHSKSKLNSTVPVLQSSPMVTRRRREANSSLLLNQNGVPDRLGLSSTSKNVTSGTRPLSSPFMPQIKRALGLEPRTQYKYGDQRRHSFGIGSLTTNSPTLTVGSLPHVRLNKTRRLSLTERNSTMLNKSSTVKIAPPAIGKVASPSLYHMRCNTSIQEDRGTPDTYAVISALKERRKRSINTFDEHTEPPQQQAKRRRQESQHSNASTSSMPSMPDNFPDLSSADFSMRLDTPGLKRPSRPSQDDLEEWDNLNSSKQHHHEGRNNSILSSLSSSQRFIESQKSKRKAESSFHEKENSSYVVKAQRKEPPKLTHLDIQYSVENASKTPTIPQVTEQAPQMTNGHPAQTRNAEKASKSSEKVEPAKQPVLPKIPSMKKTASIYSGLSSPASFKKAQYANVVATLDDYDADREAENQRVKQMLKDLDDSFSKKEAEKEAAIPSTSTLTTITTTVSVAASTSVSVTTTSSGITLDTTKTSSVLSALEKMTKSPVQETGGLSSTTAATTQPGVSFKPLFSAPSTTQTTVSSAPTGLQTSAAQLPGSNASSGNLITSQPVVPAGNQSSLLGSSTSAPGGFTLNIQKTAQSAEGLTNLTAATTTATGFALGGTNLSSQTQPSTGVGIVFGAAATTSPVAPSQAQPSVSSGFSFGTSVTSTPASSQAQPSAGLGFKFGSSATSTAAPSSTGGFSFTGAQSTPATGPTAVTTPSGFGFGSVSTTSSAPSAGGGFGFNTVSTSTAPSAAGGFGFNTVSTSTAPSAGFSFAPQPTATTAATGFTFSAAGSTAPSTGGFSFGGQAAPAVTTVASSQFGTTTSASTPAFNFGGATGTAVSGVFGVASAPGVGFAFGTKPSTTSVASVFGAPAASTAQSPFAAPVSTSQTPFGAPTGNPAAAFSFGAAKTTASAAPFSFNAGSTASSAGSTVFQTGQAASSAPAQTGLFQFGSTSTASAPTFGATTTPSVFGSSSQTPAFGSANPAPAFGSANQTPAFGSSSQTPAFGAVSNAPTFGTTNQPPTFGSATPTFGAAAANQKPNTPVFGATANSTSGSVFGSTGNTGTGFSKSHSMPAFTTNQDNASSTGTFNFGAPAPNVNPFGQGQTTPAKQTGAAFGQLSNDTTPKAQTGAMFNFGQTNNSAVKGFDFSASSATGGQSGTGGFNFMPSASMPVFNFGSTGAAPTASPAFGAPGSTPGTFAVGAGNTAPRPPRAVARANRRRTQRK